MSAAVEVRDGVRLAHLAAFLDRLDVDEALVVGQGTRSAWMADSTRGV
jgi:hypothetical protein